MVSNVGGSLTPIGDPPLFLGFLRGVPFGWSFSHLWYIWLPTILLLAAIFYVVDRRNHRRAAREVLPEEWMVPVDPEHPAPTTLPADTRRRSSGASASSSSATRW